MTRYCESRCTSHLPTVNSRSDSQCISSLISTNCTINHEISVVSTRRQCQPRQISRRHRPSNSWNACWGFGGCKRDVYRLRLHADSYQLGNRRGCAEGYCRNRANYSYRKQTSYGRHREIILHRDL